MGLDEQSRRSIPTKVTVGGVPKNPHSIAINTCQENIFCRKLIEIFCVYSQLEISVITVNICCGLFICLIDSEILITDNRIEEVGI